MGREPKSKSAIAIAIAASVALMFDDRRSMVEEQSSKPKPRPKSDGREGMPQAEAEVETHDDECQKKPDGLKLAAAAPSRLYGLTPVAVRTSASSSRASPQYPRSSPSTSVTVSYFW